MIDVLINFMLPIGILVMCVYGIGYMSGCDQTKEIYNPTLRQSDLDKIKKI